MKRLAFLFAGAAALSVAACGDADDAADDTTVVETETTLPAPVATETETVVRDIDDGDRVTVSRDGVQVDVDDGGTSVRADIDENPSVTVRD